MGWIDGVSRSGLFAKIALVLLIIDAIFNWIAFTTTSWGTVKDTVASNDIYVGIWRRCETDIPTVTNTPVCYNLDGYAKIWFGCFQGITILGFVGANVALLLVMLFMFWDGCKRNKELGQAAACTCIVSAVCWLVAVIVFGAMFQGDADVSSTTQDNNKIGFSHTIAIFALLIEAIAGVMLLIEALQSPVLGRVEKHKMTEA